MTDHLAEISRKLNRIQRLALVEMLNAGRPLHRGQRDGYYESGIASATMGSLKRRGLVAGSSEALAGTWTAWLTDDGRAIADRLQKADKGRREFAAFERLGERLSEPRDDEAGSFVGASRVMADEFDEEEKGGR